MVVVVVVVVLVVVVEVVVVVSRLMLVGVVLPDKQLCLCKRGGTKIKPKQTGYY